MFPFHNILLPARFVAFREATASINTKDVRSFTIKSIYLHWTTTCHTPGGLNILLFLSFAIFLGASLSVPFCLHQSFPLLLRLLLFQCPDLLKSAHRHLGTVYASELLQGKIHACQVNQHSRTAINVRQKAGLISFRNTESNLVASSRTSSYHPPCTTPTQGPRVSQNHHHEHPLFVVSTPNTVEVRLIPPPSAADATHSITVFLHCLISRSTSTLWRCQVQPVQ